MSKTRSTVGVIIAGLIVMSFAIPAFSQSSADRQGGPQRRGRFKRVLIRGEVIRVEGDNFVISTKDGQTKTVTVTQRTKFGKPILVDKDKLKIGNNIFALGQSAGEGSIEAKMIRVLPGENRGKPSRRRSQPPRSMDRGAKQGMPRGGRQGYRKIRGTITGLAPLTIKGYSGDTMTVEVTSNTRIIEETPASYSDLKAGDKVIVIMLPSDREAKGARRVEILPTRRTPRSATRSAPTDKSLPDLP